MWKCCKNIFQMWNWIPYSYLIPEDFPTSVLSHNFHMSAVPGPTASDDALHLAAEAGLPDFTAYNDLAVEKVRN